MLVNHTQVETNVSFCYWSYCEYSLILLSNRFYKANGSVGWYIDSTIETIDDLGLSIISNVNYIKLVAIVNLHSYS